MTEKLQFSVNFCSESAPKIFGSEDLQMFITSKFFHYSVASFVVPVYKYRGNSPVLVMDKKDVFFTVHIIW
jgi:hypothetical protein